MFGRLGGTICVVCAVVVFFSAPLVAASPFEGIKKTYGSITTLQAKFTQKIFLAGLKKERIFAGDFLYKRKKGFLWSYTEPKEKYFLYDGSHMWQGETDKTFVIKEKANKNKTGGAFLDLVEDMAAMDELFVLTKSSRSGDLELLELKPKKEGTVTYAKIWITRENLVRKIEIGEFSGNINMLEFTAVKINSPVDEGKLSFKNTGGKEILER